MKSTDFEGGICVSRKSSTQRLPLCFNFQIFQLTPQQMRQFQHSVIAFNRFSICIKSRPCERNNLAYTKKLNNEKAIFSEINGFRRWPLCIYGEG